MNNHIPQILNDDFDVFSLSDFCYWPLIFVSTVSADHAFILTAIPESCCSQLLEFMIMSTSTMLCEQWALIFESVSFAGLFLNLNQSQKSLQIPPFCSGIKNWSQGSAGGARGQGNCGRAGPGTADVRHPWEGSGCGDYEWGYGEFSSGGTVNDELVKS